VYRATEEIEVSRSESHGSGVTDRQQRRKEAPQGGRPGAFSRRGFAVGHAGGPLHSRDLAGRPELIHVRIAKKPRLPAQALL
jgi:hypothetical protein